MKKGRPMKRNVFLALAMAAPLAFAQAPAPTKEAAKPEPVKTADKPMAAKPATKKFSPKRFEDARHCLEQPSNTAIIKCAEEYL
jgi:hypothetical protein